MIGQKNLLNNLEQIISAGTFPRFSILTGPKGCGKHTVSKWIAEKLGITPYILPDVKVDTIRHAIEVSYKAVNPTLYMIYDADNMSVAAKNVLLKVTEEPPNNAYFIMTVENMDLVLDTIRSRATIYLLDNYSSVEIKEYAERNYKSTQDELDIIDELCEYPGDVDLLYESKPTDFYNYVKKVVENIAKVEGANAFKIADKLALKQDAEGYDVKLFLRAFMAICVRCMKDEPLQYATGISITSKFINQLGIKGVSKSMLIDSWILDIRNHWMR